MENSKPLIFLSAADELVAPLTSINRQRDNVRWLAAGSMTRKAALLLFDSVHVVSAIRRISFVHAQARIETE